MHNDTQDTRGPNHGGGEAKPSAATGALLRLARALIVLFWLSAHTSSQGAVGAQTKLDDVPELAALPPSLTTADDEQPVAEELMRRLWRNRLTAPKPDEEARDQTSLMELIQQVRSVRFESRSPAPATSIVSEPLIQNPPGEVPPAPQATVERAAAPVAPAPVGPEEAIPSEAMETLRELLADPNQASDPAEMAELLFLSGRIREATAFYQKALEIVTRSAPAGKEDRAWILLQLGNCLRETDPTQARVMYTALANEYPDSPWAELAKAQSQFLTWSETARPRQWVAPAKQQEVQGAASAQPSQP
jgi:tetratricopeptide (TPR) repeat protein